MTSPAPSGPAMQGGMPTPGGIALLPGESWRGTNTEVRPGPINPAPAGMARFAYTVAADPPLAGFPTFTS